MKKRLLLPLLIILASCGRKDNAENAESGNILENLTYSVDTLMVDRGEDFLNLSQGIKPFGLSVDQKQLFFFEFNPTRLVQLDLENLEVLKKTEFEAEGPDGVGSSISGLEIGSNSELFLNSNAAVGIYSLNGKKLENFRFAPSGIDSTLANTFYAVFDNARYDFGTQKIYSKPNFAYTGENILLIIDPKTNSASSLTIPNMEIVNSYSKTKSFETPAGTAMGFYAVASYTTLLPGEVILSTAAMSSFYKLDLQSENLEFVEIKHKTVPNKMDFEVPGDPSTSKEMIDIQKKIMEYINYLELQWDGSRQMYFRLGMKTFIGGSFSDPMTYEYYLFAYDQDFNVLGETKLEGIESNLNNIFFKEGKLYSYINVEDELGFAVFTFNF